MAALSKYFIDDPAFDSPEIVLHELERHLNNYFNPRNDPDSDIRNYPLAFLLIAGRIQQFRSLDKFHNNENDEYDRYTIKSWQHVFAQQLSIYKRAKFI